MAYSWGLADGNRGRSIRFAKRALRNVSLSFADQPIVSDFSTTILRGDKVGLIGPNGCGKTSLLRLILVQLPPTTGTVRQGSNLQVAYFDQMRDALDPDASLEDFISPGSEWIEIGNQRKHVKSHLADFLFSPARASAPVRSLSGGERSRLLLARLFARPANVLVLDEPTNDLDIDTLELLEELLGSYDGTVFLVSHDRSFLDNVVTSIIAHEGPGHWREYVGAVQDWLAQSARTRELPGFAPAAPKLQRAPEQPAPSAAQFGTTGVTAAQPRAPVKAKLSFKEQRELDAIPSSIEALELEQRNLHEELADGSLYRRDPLRAAALHARDAEIEDALMDFLHRWEALSAIQPK